MKLSERFKTLGGMAMRRQGPLTAVVLIVPAVLLRFSIRGADEAGLYWQLAGAGLGILGLAMRAAAAGFVGREDTGCIGAPKVPAPDRAGAYSVCRNPVYLADVLVSAGIAFTLGSWLISVTTLALLAAMYVPIMLAGARRGPRIFPHHWSWRLWIRREHNVIYGVFAAFAAALCFRVYVLTGQIPWNMGWLGAIVAATLLWLAARLITARADAAGARSAPADRGPHRGGLDSLALWLAGAGLVVLAWVGGWFLCQPHHFGVVEQGVLYRSGQPANFEQWRWVRDRYGIRTVIDLRYRRPDAPWSILEERFCRENGIRRIMLPIGPQRLTEAELGIIIRTVTDARYQPVLVHCQAGSSRTGVVVAAYRIVVDKWSVESAILESQKYKRRMNPGYAAYLAGLFRRRNRRTSNTGRYSNRAAGKAALTAY